MNWNISESEDRDGSDIGKPEKDEGGAAGESSHRSNQWVFFGNSDYHFQVMIQYLDFYN